MDNVPVVKLFINVTVVEIDDDVIALPIKLKLPILFAFVDDPSVNVFVATCPVPNVMISSASNKLTGVTGLIAANVWLSIWTPPI